MKPKTIFVFTVLLLILSAGVFAQAQEKQVSQTISFRSKFIQIKDEFNYGLVNNGLDLGVEYSLGSVGENRTFIYKTEFDFGANYKQGLGLAWTFKPVDLFYGFRLNSNPRATVTLGPYFSVYYKWLLFPELQSGHLFWLSSYEFGPRVIISMPFKGKIIDISLSSSTAGLTSRPELQTEEYFYSLTLADIIRNPHSNMTFGSQNIFNHTLISLELIDTNKKMSVNYEFEFIVFMKEPEFRYLSHSINLKWKIGNKK